MDCRWSEVISLWFCSDDHEKLLSADDNLLKEQTKFEDKKIWFEKQDPFVGTSYY